MKDFEPLSPACAGCREPGGTCFPGPCKRYLASKALGYRPKTVSESKIAVAMDALSATARDLRIGHPDIPEAAIAVALINLGVQAGVRSDTKSTVVVYLHDLADHIEGDPNVV